MSFLTHTLDNPRSATAHSVTLDDGTSLAFLETGVLRVSPARPAQYRVLISCGVHGNETAPMEIVGQLFDEIRAGKLKVGNELLFVIGNPPAANTGERFIEENLNRLFSAKHLQSSTQEAKRAALLEDYTRRFFEEGDEPRIHYDLHTAIRGSEFEKFAVYPYLHKRQWSQTQLGFLERCGVQAVLLSNHPSGTYSYFSSHEFGADAFTVELGKVAKFGENDLQKFNEMIEGLRSLIAAQETFNGTADRIHLFEVVEEVIKRSEAFKLHFAPDANNFSVFPKGVLLASDQGYEYRTQRDAERFVFPISNVPPGQRAMLIVAPTNFASLARDEI